MTNEQFLQQFGHFIDAPNGIQKLREMVLQLAVQGKLVAQDEGDEPASVLLEKAKTEKARLIKEKRIRKGKGTSESSSDQMLHEVPDGWIWCALSDVGNIFNGNSISARVKSEKYEGLETGLPYIATKDVGYGRDKLNYENGVKIPVGEEKFKVAHARAVLICSEGGSAGKKIGITEHDICFGNKLYAIETYSDINPLFIFYYYQSPGFASAFQGQMTGIIGGISLNNFISLPVPIPPVKEQHRIVAKVEELMALCDQLEAERNAREATHQRLIRAVHHPLTEAADDKATQTAWHRIRDNSADLYTTLESVQALRQTILQLAVQGKLVEQNINSISAPETCNSNNSSQVGSYEIPESWRWCKLGDLASVIGGCTFKSTDFNKKSGARVIKITNAGVGEFIETNDYLPKEFLTSHTNYVINKGDLILALTRPYISAGLKISMCPKSYDQSLLNQRVAAIRVKPIIDNKYLFLYLKSPVVLNTYKKRFGGSGLQPNLKMGDVSNLKVPFPPLTEQYRILTKVDELMALCNQLETNIRDKNDTAARYAEAVVAQVIA